MTLMIDLHNNFVLVDESMAITDDDFAVAIIATCLPGVKMRTYIEALVSPGRKEKHPGWIRVCEYLRQMKNLPKLSRIWRKEAYITFMENLTDVEYFIWSRLLEIPPREDAPTGESSGLNPRNKNDTEDIPEEFYSSTEEE